MQDPKPNLSSSVAITAPRAELKMGVFEHWPNRITALRFVGALLLFALLAVKGEEAAAEPGSLFMAIAFWLFIVTCLSDWLDGYLARSQNVVTAFGRIADPFTDKVLVLGTMIFLATMDWSRHLMPAWIVVVILAREFLITGIRGYIESVGKPFPADRFGKLKMVLQCLALGAALGWKAFEWGSLADSIELFARVTVWLTLVATVGSGLTYVAKTTKLLT